MRPSGFLAEYALTSDLWTAREEDLVRRIESLQ